MPKLPSLQFYPADWRKDMAVQSLNYEQKGIWFEILCLMHESEERGKLILNGKSMSLEALAKLLGLQEDKIKVEIKVLIERCVCKVEKVNENLEIIYNKRMVEDDKKYRTFIKKCSKAGKKGKGNPCFKKGKPNPFYDKGMDKGEIKETDKGEINSSSSSSSSSSLKKNNNINIIKKKVFLEFIELTKTEEKKLISKFGEQETQDFIERLNNYVGSKGVK